MSAPSPLVLWVWLTPGRGVRCLPPLSVALRRSLLPSPLAARPPAALPANEGKDLSVPILRDLSRLALRSLPPVTACALFLFAGSDARAQAIQKFSLDRFDPAPAGDRFFGVPGAAAGGGRK